MRLAIFAMHYDPQILRASLSNSQIERLPQALLGPDCALSLIRDVVTRCWITTPKEKKTIAEITEQVNRLVEEALRQLGDDLAEIRAEKGGNH
jgi:hypothetical protein